jgi:hypothetical protein
MLVRRCSFAAQLLTPSFVRFNLHDARLRSGLAGNQLMGTIPDWLGSLSGLSVLCAGCCSSHAAAMLAPRCLHALQFMVTPLALLTCTDVHAGSSPLTSSRARFRTRSARSQIFWVCACPSPCVDYLRMRVGMPAVEAMHALAGAAGSCLAVRLVTRSCGLLRTPHACLRRDLSTNQLTGEIPDSFGSLSILGALCVPVRWLWTACQLWRRLALVSER